MATASVKPARHRPDFILLFVVLLLVSIGLLNVYSASIIWASQHLQDTPSYFFVRQLIWALLGTFAMFFIMNFNYRFFLRLAKAGLVLSMVLLILVLLVGKEVGGAKRWIDIGFLSMQPSEFAIFSVILYIAFLLTKKEEHLSDFKKGVLPSLIIAAVPAFLILIEPDMGTSFLLLSVAFCMLYSAGTRGKHLLMILSAGALAAIYFVLNKSYRSGRISAFLDPWNPVNKDSAHQLKNSLYAISSGGWTGRGLGHSIEKFLYLPEPHTDFIYAILTEEWGIIGATVVILLFAILIWRGTVIAARIPDRFAFLFSIGITSMIGIAAIVNIAMVIGLFPVVGIPLPFISYGGSSLFVKMISMGILLNISRYTVEERVPLRHATPAHSVPQPIRRSRFDAWR